MPAQPIPTFIQVPPNSSGLMVDGVQLTVDSKIVFRENGEVATPVNPQRYVFTQNVAANSVGAPFTCAAIPPGLTGYLMKVKLASTGFFSGGSSGDYTLCSAGCSQTIPASPFVVAYTTHLQGVNAFAYAFDSAGDEIFPPSFSVARSSNGNLTITYVTVPSRIVITGPGNNAPVGCQWTVMSGSNVLGNTITGEGSDVYEPPHRFFDQCPQGQAFSVTPSNPSGGAITVYATIWFDQF